MSAGSVALLLLAAGRGSRFGGGKLAANLCGKPVARHVSDALAALPFSRKLAVCSTDTPHLAGFKSIMLDPVDAPMSRSIATGIAALVDADAVLIALADMPLVPVEHFVALLRAFDGNSIGTRVGSHTMAPAIFGRQHFPALLALEGDRGAGALLYNAPAVDLVTYLALDIDRPGDLTRAEAILRNAPPPVR